MNNQFDKGEPLELHPDALRELASDYFAEDFPNPDRSDCPAPARLQSLAQTGGLPDDQLRAHLFGCSACFTAYREARALRPVAAPQESWRDKLATTFAWRPGLAWAGAAVLLLGLVWLMRTPRHSEQAAPPVLLANQSPTPTLAPVPSLVTATPAPAALTQAVDLPVDLNDYLALRDVTAPNGERVIRLTPTLTHLQLRLPEGSLPGAYTVSLVDDAERPVLPAQTLRRRGDSLLALFDLRRLAAKRVRLRVQAAGEAPDFYPVQIGSKQ